MSEFLSVGEVARRSGVAVSALHFYERRGLIRSVRTAGNLRRYHRGTLRRLAVIRVAQDLGLSLAEIGAALSHLGSGPPGQAEWAALSASWHDDLTRRIEGLIALRDRLAGCIGCGCLSTAECPLRNPGDRLAAEGAGPRLLRE